MLHSKWWILFNSDLCTSHFHFQKAEVWRGLLYTWWEIIKMFEPLLILLGIFSITLAQDYSQSNTYNQELNGFGHDFATNPEGSNDYLESGIDYHNEMIPNHSDYNGGIMIFLICTYLKSYVWWSLVRRQKNGVWVWLA